MLGHVDAATADAAAKTIRAELENAGFAAEYTPHGKKIAGLEPVFSPPELRPPTRRLGDLDRALEFLETSSLVVPEFVEVVFGIFVGFHYCGEQLFSRPSRCIRVSRETVAPGLARPGRPW